MIDAMTKSQGATAPRRKTLRWSLGAVAFAVCVLAVLADVFIERLPAGRERRHDEIGAIGTAVGEDGPKPTLTLVANSSPLCQEVTGRSRVEGVGPDPCTGLPLTV